MSESTERGLDRLDALLATLVFVTLVFVTLKLTGVIDWSWWWVLAPMWIPVALLLVVGLLAICMARWLERGGGR